MAIFHGCLLHLFRDVEMVNLPANASLRVNHSEKCTKFDELKRYFRSFVHK